MDFYLCVIFSECMVDETTREQKKAKKKKKRDEDVSSPSIETGSE